jgi:hypothetical protein
LEVLEMRIPMTVAKAEMVARWRDKLVKDVPDGYFRGHMLPENSKWIRLGPEDSVVRSNEWVQRGNRLGERISKQAVGVHGLSAIKWIDDYKDHVLVEVCSRRCVDEPGNYNYLLANDIATHLLTLIFSGILDKKDLEESEQDMEVWRYGLIHMGRLPDGKIRVRIPERNG